MIDVQIGDSRRLIHGLKDKSIDCVVTSPPYWGLRDYKTEPIIFDGVPDCEHEWGASAKGGDIRFRGVNSTVGNHKNPEIASGNSECNFCSLCGAWRGQLGLEPTPELFIKHLLDFFDDVKLKLKDAGNCFVNLGDTYFGGNLCNGQPDDWQSISTSNKNKKYNNDDFNRFIRERNKLPFAKKSLLMIPQRFAWGMIERGWILRNEIIWYKRNHMPESVTDRWTKAHEVIYFFTKQQKNYFNLDAIRRPHKGDNQKGSSRKIAATAKFGATSTFNGNAEHSYNPLGANPGTVWDVTTQPYSEAHFATFPIELVRQPILAGCPPQGLVLDPFAGSGTVGEFCRNNDRNAILFELNPEYKKLIEDRAMLLVPELSSWCSSKGDA